MSITPVEHAFADADAQAQGLAEAVASRLREGIAARGSAWIAVPGGETPRKFLAALARQALEWLRVSVILTDERLVPADDPRSNARLLREVLLDQVPAKFFALADVRSREMASSMTAQELPQAFDCIVLGMGADGHCASLFADGDSIAAALNAGAPPAAMPLCSPSAPEPRVTLTLSALVATRALFVLIRGVEKRRTLEAALCGTEPFSQAPIRAVLEQAAVAPQIYWSP